MKSNEIDVLYPTHGCQIGAQVQFDPATHIWTVFTKQGLERSFSSLSRYVRFMMRG